MNCSETGHTARFCRKLSKCINCKGNHATNSENCSLVRAKIYSDNSYILSILVGEGIIESNEGILKTSNDQVTVDMSNIKQYIDNKIEKCTLETETKINLIADEQLKLKARLFNVEQRTDVVEKDLAECKNEIKNCRVEVTECRTEIGKLSNQVSESKNEIQNSIETNNMAMMNQLIQMNQFMQTLALKITNSPAQHEMSTPPGTPNNTPKPNSQINNGASLSQGTQLDKNL